MVRYKRALALRPVMSDKREITWSNLAQNASTNQDVTIATAVVPGSVSTSTEVAQGSVVPWIFFEINFSANSASDSKVIHWKVHKVPSGLTGTTNANTYNQPDKKFIFKRGMEMLPASGSSSQTKRIFAVSIPKRYRKMNDDDTIYFSYICSSTVTINVCGIAIFKARN